MLEEVIRQQEQLLPIMEDGPFGQALFNIENDELSNQINAQIFEFCDSELFPPETLQNSDEVTSSSNNGCYEENSSYPTNFNSYQDHNNVNSNTDTNCNNNNISIIFDSQDEIDNEISASIDFTPSPPTFSMPPLVLTTQQDQFDFSSIQPPISLPDPVVDGFSHYPADPIGPLIPPSLPPVFEDDCLSSVPSYTPSCSFLGAPMAAYLPSGTINPAAFSADNSGLFASTMLIPSDLQTQHLDFQGDTNGLYSNDPMQRVFNPRELQALGAETQQLMGGAGNTSSLAPEIPNMGDQTFKVGKLSVEQRKEKIHRYMKKRNERNFSKKIKYACRKTLADSRPRVRGRFAKNDEFGETQRQASSNHEEEDDEEVIVKEEDQMVDSSDIFAHISGVNSFKCNFPIQSWI
ncbi:hypothetical protein UlMin_010064 [Ulmus minor]